MNKMKNIRHVRDQLGLLHIEVIKLVQNGRLRAYRYAGTGPVSRSEVMINTTGLRFKESDVWEMLDASLVT